MNFRTIVSKLSRGGTGALKVKETFMETYRAQQYTLYALSAFFSSALNANKQESEEERQENFVIVWICGETERRHLTVAEVCGPQRNMGFRGPDRPGTRQVERSLPAATPGTCGGRHHMV